MTGVTIEGTRAALYTRVSSDEQAREGFSLGVQLDRLRAYAAAQGWTNAREYVDDGHSGRSAQRPAYERMMTEHEDWDTVLVMKLDRVHRNSRNFMAMMDRLTKEGKGFASVTENLDTTTAMGRFVMDTIQRIAQLEAEQIGERCQMGRDGSARKGNWPTRAPFGWRRATDDRALTLDPDEAPVIQELYLRVAEGESLRSVAEGLGIKYQTASEWVRHTKYMGQHVYNGVALSIPPIVDESLWHEANAVLDEACQRHTRHPRRLGVPINTVTA